MPKTQREDNKKHGDKLEPLIERTGGGSSPRDREQTGEDSPEELQDDDDEDVQNDDPADRRDVGERD